MSDPKRLLAYQVLHVPLRGGSACLFFGFFLASFCFFCIFCGGVSGF